MNRRYFLKTASILTFATSSAFLMMAYLGRLFRKDPSPYGDDLQVKDEMAFCHTVYPLFSDDALLADADEILRKKREWETIGRTFFSHYYGQGNKGGKPDAFFSFSKKTATDLGSKERFADLPLTERERAIVAYIDVAGRERPADRDAFDLARNAIIHHMIRHSYSPFSAYGYPDRRILPFMADPSWPEYHLKPGAGRGGEWPPMGGTTL